MLKNVKLYEEEAERKSKETWYDLKYQWWCGWCGTREFDFASDNYNSHCFASVDPKTNEVIGLMGYEVDWAAKSTSGFYAASFDESGRAIFAKDLLEMIDDIFMKYDFKRMEWRCWADNPAIRGYRKFCKRVGGREVGTLYRAGILLDGQIHDNVIFELLQEDYLKAKQEERI